jgi:hypothetical protein
MGETRVPEIQVQQQIGKDLGAIKVMDSWVMASCIHDLSESEEVQRRT